VYIFIERKIIFNKLGKLKCKPITKKKMFSYLNNICQSNMDIIYIPTYIFIKKIITVSKKLEKYYVKIKTDHKISSSTIDLGEKLPSHTYMKLSE